MEPMNELTVRPGTERDLPALLALSAEWAAENITYGYYANSEKEFTGYRSWVAERDGVIVGYAAGQMESAQRDSSIQKKGDCWFELEELYVTFGQRNLGIGNRLLEQVEEDLCREGCRRLMLSGANREQDPLLRFYGKHRYKTYSVRMFKDIG